MSRQPRHRSRRITGFLSSRIGSLAVLASLFLAVRLPVALSSPRVVEPEELYIGTIAKEILLGDYPCGFFELQYGHHDFGSLVNGVLAAGLFFVAGPSALALQILALGFALTAYLASIAIARHLGGVNAGRVTALFLLLPPPILVRASLSAQGNHGESIAFEAVALLATLGVLRMGKEEEAGSDVKGRTGPPIWARLALIGLVLGAGITYYFGLLLAAAALLALLLMARPSVILGWKGLCLIAGAVVGAIPWIYSAFVVGQANPDKLLSAGSSALNVVRSVPTSIEPWPSLLETGRDLQELLWRELPVGFSARWPASSRIGQTLSASVAVSTGEMSGAWTGPSNQPWDPMIGGWVRPPPPSGVTWYLLCVLGVVALAGGQVWAIVGRARRRGPDASTTAGRAGVPSRSDTRSLDEAMPTGSGIPLLFFAIYAVGSALTGYGLVDIKSLSLYPGDEYVAYRCLVPAIWMLVLGAAVATGIAIDTRRWWIRSTGLGALVLAAFLGAMSFFAYLDDPLVDWDPLRTARQRGTNYAPLGIKLATDAEEERLASLERFNAGGLLDPQSWTSFNRLKVWTARREGDIAETMAAHYVADLLTQPGQPEPERAEAYLAELHGLCGSLTRSSREVFCRILHAGIPSPSTALRRPPSLSQLYPPHPRSPHPVCGEYGCCTIPPRAEIRHRGFRTREDPTPRSRRRPRREPN